MSLTLALLLAVAPSTVPADPPTIVVTARSLADTDQALRNCLARNCSPEEDIAATVAHAENLFVGGRYDDALGTVERSLGRNARYRKQLPVPVSGLYLAKSRIGAHLGFPVPYKSGTIEAWRTLRGGLPNNDPRVLTARFDVAGMQLSLGQSVAAEQSYNSIRLDALGSGRRDLAQIAAIRLAWIKALKENRVAARRDLERIATDADPNVVTSRIAARVLLARLDRMEGKPSNVDSIITDMKGAAFDQPVLLFTPDIPLTSNGSDRAAGDAEGGVATVNVLSQMAMDVFDKRWIDVGYWIDSNGRVSDVEILRSSGTTDWSRPLLASVGGRIYAPLKSPSGSYRVERFTYTSQMEKRTGTRVLQRSAKARIESLDLSAN